MPFKTQKLKDEFIANLREGESEGMWIQDDKFFDLRGDTPCACALGIAVIKTVEEGDLVAFGNGGINVFEHLRERYGLNYPDMWHISDASEEINFEHALFAVDDIEVEE